MSKLLDRAKDDIREVPRLRIVSKFKEDELIELSIAWMRGEINHGQASRATKRSGSAIYGLLAVSLKRAYAKGLITIK
jgi:hypothetical protein